MSGISTHRQVGSEAGVLTRQRQRTKPPPRRGGRKARGRMLISGTRKSRASKGAEHRGQVTEDAEERLCWLTTEDSRHSGFG